MSEPPLNPLRMALAVNADTRFGPAERVALIGAVAHADNASKQVRFSQQALASELGVSRDTVKRAFAKGLQHGYFTHKQSMRNDRGHRVADYFLAALPPKVQEKAWEGEPNVQAKVQEKSPSTTSTSNTPSGLTSNPLDPDWVAANAPPFGDDPAQERCLDHGGVYLKAECPHCENLTRRARSEERHSEEQRRQWYENQNDAEGLNSHGYFDADEDHGIARHQGRARARG